MIGEDPMLSELVYAKIAPVLKEDIWKCNLAPDDVKHCVKTQKDPFWTQILMLWCQENYCEQSENRKEIMNQLIWNNSKIRQNNKPFLFDKAYEDGLRQIAQLVNINGELFNALETITIMQSNTILSALPKRWKEILKSGQGLIEEIPTKFDFFCNTEKKCCKILSKKE